MNRIGDNERTYVLEVLDNGFRTSRNNVFTSRVEAAFAKRFESRHALSFANGTATLHTALNALGVGPRDEVIVPPLTMSSPALSVLHNQSVPVFADVDPKTFTLDPASVAERVTARTKAVMPVALYGASPDYDPLLDICREHGLGLIEDNAQCFLGTYKGKRVGTFGHFASYSFQASKHMTCGEGGMLTTDDDVLATKARRFSSLGYGSLDAGSAKIEKKDILSPHFARHVSLGFNYRMSELQSAVTLGQLERLEELVAVRQKAAALFREVAATASWLRPQATFAHSEHSCWTQAFVLETDVPEKDWFRFRDIFSEEKGDDLYAAWRLSYLEPLFTNEIQHMPGVTQHYGPGLCPTAEHLQARLLQFKTNYWEEEEAHRQAEALHRTIQRFGGPKS